MSPEEAKTAFSYGKYIALDTESTGFQPNDKFSFLLEIGAVKYKNGHIVDKFDELINPGIKIPKKIEELTGISDEQVADKDNYIGVLNRFKKWCEDDEYILIMHNAPHDLNFLNYFGKKCGIDFNYPFIDTQPLSKNILKNCWKEINSKVNENYKLSTLAHFYDIEDINHHRADNDAELTLNVFLKLKQTAMKKEPMLVYKQDWKFPSKNVEAPASQEKRKIKILSISPWDKKKRIYISFETKDENNEKKFGTVYYDFDYKCWGIKECAFPIKSFDEIENIVKMQYLSKEFNYDDFKEKKYPVSCFTYI